MLFVAIDKFTKWIEAVPTGEIKADNAIKFIKGIFCRYGLPHQIITDNGSQFISADFQDYCIGLGVKICFASVSHPQSNGQVERANGIVRQGIKTRVYDRLMSHEKKWVEELHHYYGPYAPHRQLLIRKHPSSSCTAPRPCSPASYDIRVHEYRSTPTRTRWSSETSM